MQNVNRCVWKPSSDERKRWLQISKQTNWFFHRKWMHLAENRIKIRLKFDSKLSNGPKCVANASVVHEKVFRSLAKKKNGHCLGAIIC